ncbi:hypothetical protein YDYSG_03330 [Paenibacillus tyrfis]|nr:hypothetical protein YDYSG_03330 [Paenibacillus tyrfis]
MHCVLGINDNFGEHFRMITISPASGVSCVEDGVVKPIHGGIHNANEAILGMSSSKSIGKQN